MAPRFADRHVLVTGAGTGIGRAIALRLAAEGATLSLLARDRARLDATVAAAVGAGSAPAHCTASCDVRDAAAVDAAVAAAVARHGPLYAAIANAGVGGPNAPAAPGGAPDRFHDLVATNLVGTYHVLRAAERHLAPRPATGYGARHLVAVASILARIGVAGYTGYCASKAGITGLVRALAQELAPAEVQVNALCPGWVDTEMSREGIAGLARALGVDEATAYARAMQDVPLGRMSAPEDIAGVVAWLLSPDARGVTGQALDVNGGAYMA